MEFVKEYIDSDLQHDSKMIICIEERDEADYAIVDSRLFIMYDEMIDKYVVFGKRGDIRLYRGVPYVFAYNTSKNMTEFVKNVISNRKCSITWYNYNNIIDKYNDLTFEFFEDLMDQRYEIIAYDRIKLNYRILQRQICLLRQESK